MQPPKYLINCLSYLLKIAFTVLLLWNIEISNAQAILGAGTRSFLSKQTQSLSQAKTKPSYYELKLLVNNNFNINSLPQGSLIKTQTKEVITISLPTLKLKELLENKGIQLIEKPYPMGLTMDTIKQYTKANLVHQGIGIQSALRGKGVVVGIIDQGFDYTHPNFLNSEGRTRIKRIWNQNDSLTKPSPQPFNYGHEIIPEVEPLPFGFDNYMGESHGTHTAGIAAGSAYLSTRNMSGIAPEADLVLVSSSLNDNSVIDATKYIFDYARSVGKPAVINMSFGGWGTPMDGTNLLDRGLDALTGEGRLIVASMGNEGAFFSNIRKQIPQGDSIVIFSRLSQLEAGIFRGFEPIFDFWAGLEEHFEVKPILFNAFNSRIAEGNWISNRSNRRGEQITLETGNLGTITLLCDAYTAYPTNRNPRVYFEVENTLPNVYLGFVVRPTSKGSLLKFHSPFINNVPVNNNWIIPALELGSNVSSIRTPATARTVIAVGSHLLRNSFRNARNEVINIPVEGRTPGDIAIYSSRGPTDDGRLKPDVASVGDLVFSSFSRLTPIQPSFVYEETRLDGVIYRYSNLSGTSMSGPVVAGAVALGLERYPKMGWGELKQFIQASAQQDELTDTYGKGNNTTFGAGRLEIQRFIQLLESKLPTINTETKVIIAPNPSSLKVKFIAKGTDYNRAELTVSDMQGRKVMQTAIFSSPDFALNIEELAPAVYIFQLKFADGSSQTSRVVKLNQ